ncbi:hypothetical protein SASPL_132058 [Salvia splendens]|uniref:Uncharacterized protein n=1 Tax=Salvia splendens TaxID=180675 RepID=A0A8X8XAF2_SALSN|nr:hypothetical protein SASPL_132058 [Salvia splendens]
MNFTIKLGTKFVDFTVPDHYSPDDHYWFCLRVARGRNGSEAIYNNFVLRVSHQIIDFATALPLCVETKSLSVLLKQVMAARSPNVRLRKALDRNASRTPTKCPLSAPPKSSKPRLSRMAVISSMSKKMDEGRKRSVQHPKRINVEVPKSRMVAKALVFRSPKKAIKVRTSVELRTPVSKLCQGMNRLEISSQRRKPLQACKGQEDKSGRSIRTKTKGQLSQKQERKKFLGKDETHSLKKEESCAMENSGHKSQGRNGLDFEDGDDKENAAASDENRMPSNILKQNGRQIFGVLEKCDQVRKKVTQAHDILKEGLSGPVTKLKKPKATNPKPFRLRTDERGVLKEATLDRRVGVDPQLANKRSPAVVSKTPKRQERLKSAASMTPESNRSKEQTVKSSAMQRLEKFRKLTSSSVPKRARPQGVESRKQELISLLIPGQKLDVIHETSPQVSEPQSTGKAAAAETRNGWR